MKRLELKDGWLFTRNSEHQEPVSVPHDAMLAAGRSADAASGSAQAFYLGGTYRYERTLEKVDAGTSAILEFEGVYKNAKVSVNDELVAQHAYGYTGFFVDVSEQLAQGDAKLVVECENSDQPDSRWYSGAGIYRPVYLWTAPSVCALKPQSIKVKTASLNPVTVEISVVEPPSEASLEVQILDGETVLASESDPHTILELPDATPWSPDVPKLYTARVTCTVGKKSDTAEVCFGLRTIEVKSGEGLLLNGKSTLLRGGCVHQDSGILGAATFAEAEYRRVKMLKEAGYNALRVSHNPANTALLDACDELGMMVVDEAWDMWFNHKNKYDYASQWQENHLDDLSYMANRDYNHPSVIAYSIGNEISEPASERGLEAAQEMIEHLHALDNSRPVTAGANLMIIDRAKKGKGVYAEDGGRDDSGEKAMSGMNSTMFNLIASMIGSGMNKAANSSGADQAASPFLDSLDFAGYNYASGRYAKDAQLHPDRVIWGSETFPGDIYKNWQQVKALPNLVGDFMWTAWDYLGEAGIGAWAYTDDGKSFNKPYPWLLADTGAMDILGNPTGELYLARAAWELDEAPAICVRPLGRGKATHATWRSTNSIPSWSWQGCEGEKAVVEVFSHGATVELYLNAHYVGKKRVRNGVATFKVRYEPGELRAIAYDAAGKSLGESKLQSAKEPKLTLAAESSLVKPHELVYIQANLADELGVIESSAHCKVSLEVEGGELLAFGSANPRTEEGFISSEHTTYYGRALAVVRAGDAQYISIKATSDLGNAEISIPVGRD